MRLLGLDVGTKRIGVAFCDTNVGIVFPRESIFANDKVVAIKKIIDIVIKDKIDKIVVGLPLNFNSTRSKIQGYIEDFCSNLKKEVNVEVETFDERFTTRIAQDAGVKNIDSVSAKIILEDYIKSKGLYK
ncbi:MAG: Holliday junction resolvase RuvX [Brevinematia bacterium]